MSNLSENYYYRKCLLERDQVPTQTLIKKIMTPALADVYFKSMNPKLKVIAGLEPPLKGGGRSWYAPPEELLKSRAVLKPLNNNYMKQLTCSGLEDRGKKLLQVHRDRMLNEMNNMLYEYDLTWQKRVDDVSRDEWVKCAAEEVEINRRHIRNAYTQFSVLYSTSLNKLQDVMFDAAVTKINNTREDTFRKMKTKLERLVMRQATLLHDKYAMKLMERKDKIKTKFILNLEEARTTLGHKLHDINLGKHVAIEKLRHYLESQYLASQVYVALKEREECSKDNELAKQKQSKKAKLLSDTEESKKIEIRLAAHNEKKRNEINRIWKKKVCHVVKKFQLFVSYCLKTLPEHADFFINMEKLMLLQLNESWEDPCVESVIAPNVEQFHIPVPKPHPFYLFCEKSNKPEVNQNLCPKHCTSSASQLPVIVINKRCIYAACHNIEHFIDTIQNQIHGNTDDDADFKDDRDYSHYLSVKYTASTQLLELKLESSLQQVLQREIANIKEVSFVCRGCQLPHCFDCSRSSSVHVLVQPKQEIKLQPLLPEIKFLGKQISTRQAELVYEREPKWQSYAKYIQTKKCDCSKTAKKDLPDYLPVYMRKMSRYEPPELLNYEPCPVSILKDLIKKSKPKKEILTPVSKMPSKTKETFTQCSDVESTLAEYLCTCFSDESILLFFKKLASSNKSSYPLESQFRVVGDSISQSYLTKVSTSFANDRVESLNNLLDQAPEVKEIFKTKDCF